MTKGPRGSKDDAAIAYKASLLTPRTSSDAAEQPSGSGSAPLTRSNTAPVRRPEPRVMRALSVGAPSLRRQASASAISSSIMDPNIPQDTDAANKMPLRQRTDATATAAAMAGSLAPTLSGPSPIPAPTSAPLPPTADEYRTITIRTFDSDERTGFQKLLGKLLDPLGLKKGPFVGNAIKTSKYTLLTFVPLNLFEQFKRVANLYFAFMIILQIIPGLSPVPWYTSFFPLAVVLIVNMVKEGYDDFWRHVNDQHINNQKVWVLREDKDIQVTWRELQVGDLVKVNDNDPIPADIVLLSSSDPDNLCYVETANLDGETNLKVKYCYPGTVGMDDAAGYTARTDFIIRCEHPNPRLYTFEGAVSRSNIAGVGVNMLRHIGAQADTDPLDASNLLLRGSTLRKTEWVIGVVVFTGSETKIMQNQLPSSRKVTQLERNTNVLVVGMLIYLLSMSVLLATAHEIWEATSGNKAWYLQRKGSWPDLMPGFADWLVTIIRFILLMAQTIPISLYVTLEMVKVLQCKLLYERDLLMYHKDTDTPLVARTTTLNEELGQVEYVLSDKTGTLTQNIMGFVWASFGGKLYGSEMAAARQARPAAAGTGAFTLQSGDSLIAAGLGDEAPQDTPHSIALDAGVQSALAAGNEDAQQFFTALALCNTVVPTVTEHGQLLYQAASPDEEALVQGAAYLGLKLLSRSADAVELARRLTAADRSALLGKASNIKKQGSRTPCSSSDAVERWAVLAVIEFSSDRKRMSTVCRSPEGRIFLHCKGADTMILERLKPGQQLEPIVRRHLDQMAGSGYRTLCVAQKELTEEEFGAWFKEWNAACSALDSRDEKMAAVAEQLERDMVLLGATAVEDKLQDGVPETLAKLLAMGIKVWVLTGDKVETAISIARTCRLLTDSMTVLEIRDKTLIEQGRRPQQVLEALAAGLAKPSATGESISAGLVIDGHALAICLLDDDTAVAFLELCKLCKSVVCCRVSPMQKAQVTKLVKHKAGAVTLGIGDGANDVSMIQAAHIGCGISGREGRAAVMASDFSFAQFRFLARLLLIHGRWSYKRCCEVVQYAFYKNLVYVLAYVLFSCFCGFSAQAVFPAVFLATYNAFWTAFPTIFYALMEQDLPANVIWANPGLYRETAGHSRKLFFRQTFSWLSQGLWHGLIAFFVPYMTLSLTVGATPTTATGTASVSRSLLVQVAPNGIHANISNVGTAIFTAVLLTVTFKVVLRSSYVTWINHLAIWGPLVLWLPFLAAYQNAWVYAQTEGLGADYKMFTQLAGQPVFWLSSLIGAPLMALLIDFAIDQFYRHTQPQAYQLLQENEAVQAKHLKRSYRVFSRAAEAAKGRPLQPGPASGRLATVEEGRAGQPELLAQGTPRSDQQLPSVRPWQQLSELAGTGAQYVSAAAVAAVSAAQPIVRAAESVRVDLATLSLSRTKRQRLHSSTRAGPGMEAAAAAAVAAVDGSGSPSAGAAGGGVGSASQRSRHGGGGGLRAAAADAVALDI